MGLSPGTLRQPGGAGVVPEPEPRTCPGHPAGEAPGKRSALPLPEHMKIPTPSEGFLHIIRAHRFGFGAPAR